MSEENREKKTALQFETVTASGLVFESDSAPSVEDSIVPRDPVSEDAETPGLLFEETVPKTKENTSDSLNIKKTYFPRFTEVSERYRSVDRSKLTERPTVNVKAWVKPEEPSLDPTAELDEQRRVRKVVVSSGARADDTFSDESIKIYKFDSDERPQAPKIPDAGKISAESVKPILQESAERSADEVPEESAVPEVEKEETEETPERAILPSPVRKYAEGEEPKGSHEDVRRPKNKLFPEYTSRAERDGFKDRFLDALMSVRVRFAAIGLIILALIAEEIVLLGVSPFDMGGFLAGNGALVDLLFSTALFALSIPEIIRAVRYAVKRQVTPELMLPLSYLFILVYSLSAALGGELGVRYAHFSLPFSVQIAFSTAAAYFRLDGEFISFKMISTGKEMWVLDERFTRTLDKENIALDGAVDEYSSKLARVFRTSFVSDYSANTAKIRESSANVLTSLGVSVGAALLTGAITLFLTDSTARFPAALEAFLLVFFFASPAISLLVHKLPLSSLLRTAREREYTFVGEGSVMDTADVDVIAYDDTEIFGKEDVSIRKVHLYGKVYNTAKAMEEMYSLFSVVGGPLLNVFSQSLDRKCSSAESVTVFDDGLVGSFEGHQVMAGSLDFMLRNNVKIPEEDYKTKPDGSDTTRVMYGAEDGAVYVKFFIRYSFMEEFSSFLPDLRREHIVPLVYTRDPNIDAEMIRTLTLGDDVIRVLKERELPVPNEVYPHISSAEVSLGEKFSVPEMLLTARAYKSHITAASLGELGIMFFGASVASVLSFVLMDGLSGVPSFVPAIYQLLPGAVLFLFTKLKFRPTRKDKEN